MRLMTCHAGRLRALVSEELPGNSGETFFSGVAGVDGLLPAGRFERGAVHEILSDARVGSGYFFAMLLARGAAGDRPILWCDPERRLYPPALAAAGIDLRRFYLLRPKTSEELVWAITESLRCRAVGAVVASPGRLSPVEARRLQLAAETGQGAGLLLRAVSREQSPAHYAAATRWVVSPAAGNQFVQRWNIRLIHSRQGVAGGEVVLEQWRQTGRVGVVEFTEIQATAKLLRA
jgi:hypothetical protein